MNQRKVQQEIERRAVGELVEVRATETGGKKIRGYALKWNTRYNMGWFTEEIHRDALNESDMTDVRALLNHDANIVLGRTTSGTLRLLSDDTGLLYEVDLPDTQAARDLAVSIERGDISQSSWGFMLRVDADDNGDEWKRENGKDHRVIKRVGRVFDVSAVTFPANPDTSVAKRSLEHFSEIDENEEKLNQRGLQLKATLALYPNT